MVVKGITFDLWDTVLIDDSDEPKRAKAGCQTKLVERRELVHAATSKLTDISFKSVSDIYDEVDSDFRNDWHNNNITRTVVHRLNQILDKLNVSLSEDEMIELVRLHEEMELVFRPDFVTGVHEAIARLSEHYQLGIISDAIFSPGRVLRTLLRDEGLLDYFDTFAFSDEVGHSKPHQSMFQHAWEGLHLFPSEVVHIGDRETNDIAGPHEFGMKAILCIAAVDRGSANTKADGIFNDYSDLSEALEKIKGS